MGSLSKKEFVGGELGGGERAYAGGPDNSLSEMICVE
jgi:hypothetical protein